MIRQILRIVGPLFAILVAAFMARFTQVHLKEEGMVWWGGWIAFGLAVLAACYLLASLVRLEVAHPFLRRLKQIAIGVLVVITVLFVWEGLTRGLLAPTAIFPPPSLIFEAIATR